jgi:hypothetical protein
MTRFSYALACALAACTSSGGPATTPDGSNGADGSTPGLDPADCMAFAQNAVDAQNACGPGAPPNGVAVLTAACKKGLQKASLCGGNPAGGLACFRHEDPSDWVCQLGVVLPYCNNDLESAIGMYCLIKLGDPSCASISCTGSLDCPTGSSCNQATHQCFSDSANCVGLPCNGSLDCPTGETCNQAEHACIMQ